MVLEEEGFAAATANVDEARRGGVDLKALVETHAPVGFPARRYSGGVNSTTMVCAQ
jgi:hypothetical protein